MTDEGSVTTWLRQFQDGDAGAATQLWQRYWRRMVGLASKQLGASRRAVADEEDVALSAFSAFCAKVRADGFKKGLDDRNDLWQILALLTKRKAIDHFRRDQRRDEEGESALSTPDETNVAPAQAVAASGVAAPDEILAASENITRLLMLLPDERTRQIACLKLEGYNNHEIADHVGCSLRTTERRVEEIKSAWAKEVGHN